MIIGALVTKYLQKKQMKNHSMLIFACVLIGFFSFLFVQTLSSLWLGVWLCFISVGYTILEIILNVCILMTN